MTLKLRSAPGYNAKDRTYIDNWLQIAVKPGIKELTLSLCSENHKVIFPCSLLSGGVGDSIQYLHLSQCSFHPTVELCCLRNLTKLEIWMLRTTDEELGCLLSNSFALHSLGVRYCSKIVCVKIPCVLRQLSCLEVIDCSKLQAIESKAANLSRFRFIGDLKVHFSLGEALRVKNLDITLSSAVYYTLAELASRMPKLETILIHSLHERVNTPTVSSKFLHLKHLSIALTAPSYDYCSLVSFLDASPSLETFGLNASNWASKHVSVFEDPTELRQFREHNHENLNYVKISGFSSAKSLLELACHILGSTTSLKWLILETKQ